jgi:serine/threonine protein kinase
MTASWPRLADYNAAFLNPASGLVPASLKNVTVRRNSYDIPQPVSGGFALTYEVTDPTGKHMAVRCFTEELSDRDRRVMSVLSRLAEAMRTDLEIGELFVAAEWIPECVRYGGRSVPAVVMDWVDGLTLGTWLERNHRDSRAVRRLREDLIHLGETLAGAGISHGDLQTGNILVQGDGSLRLIDYDGLRFFDETAVPASERGHPNFQHPERDQDIPPELSDRFSLLVMDFSLRILEFMPGLHEEFSTGENILFTRDDFLFPESSELLASLSADTRFAHDAVLFSRICAGDVLDVPSVPEFLALRSAGAETTAASATRRAGSEPAQEAAAHRTGRVHAAAAGSAAAERKVAYQGPYPVISALRKDEIRRNEGRMVEVIGAITDVYTGTTKYGDPYAFVNFGDYRTGAFRLVIWSEGLDTMTDEPDCMWVGKWVSATGLVDEQYTNKFGVRSSSITILDASQLHFISRETARYRLGETERDLGTTGMGRPQWTAAQASEANRTRTAATSTPSNADLLKKLHEPEKKVQSRPAPPVIPKKARSGKYVLLVITLVVIILWMILSGM